MVRKLLEFKLLDSLSVMLMCLTFLFFLFRIQTTGYRCIAWSMETEGFSTWTTSSVMLLMTRTE